jgi:hypothetical protein
MGGTSREDANAVYCLITLCFRCHDHVESERAEAYVRGWLVSYNHDPAKVPVAIPRQVTLPLERWPYVWLTADFGYATDPPPLDGEPA